MTIASAPAGRGWALFRVSMMAVCLFFVAACTGSAENATPRPTLTLIPATATPTNTPLPPTRAPNLTPTVEQLLASTLTAPTATVASSGDALAVTDPIASELIGIAQRFVAAEIDLPVRRVRLVSYESYQWTDSSLGCPLPDQVYVPVISDGYRIVLEVGDTEYFFHTDFDRVMPCPEGSEVLPDPEATEPASAPAETPTPTPELVG